MTVAPPPPPKPIRDVKGGGSGWDVVWLLVGCALLLAICWFAVPYRAHAAGFRQCGIASWYGPESGSRTANGERFPTGDATAAHKTLPFGTIVTVTDQDTGRSIRVRINDRGPFVRGRIIDLSPAARRALHMGGLAKVCIGTSR